MKEATSELNITVIVAISIGILAAFFFGSMWPAINHNFKSTSQCSKAICDCSSDARESAAAAGHKASCKCQVKPNDEDEEDTVKVDEIFYCPFKG